MLGLSRLYSSGVAFDPDTDIPSLDGKVVLITGGELCPTSLCSARVGVHLLTLCRRQCGVGKGDYLAAGEAQSRPNLPGR